MSDHGLEPRDLDMLVAARVFGMGDDAALCDPRVPFWSTLESEHLLDSLTRSGLPVELLAMPDRPAEERWQCVIADKSRCGSYQANGPTIGIAACRAALKWAEV